MRSLFQAFWQEEDGAAAIEYALIAALIAVGLAAGATALSTEFEAAFGRLAALLQ
jgi:pilus assembly protein Flp/PilA